MPSSSEGLDTHSRTNTSTNAFDFDATEPIINEPPWHNDPSSASHIVGAEWAKLSSDFTNAGYREGITAGKESALREGFDASFAQIGVPLGRELGIMRGLAAALQHFLNTLPQLEATTAHMTEARDIPTQLAEVHFADVALRNLEAEQHAREHLATYGDEIDGNEEAEAKWRVEKLTAGTSRAGERARPGVEDVRRLKVRLEVLGAAVGIDAASLWS